MAALRLFMSPSEDGGPSGEERAAKLTEDVWKETRGAVSPARLWSMPMRHIAMLWFETPGREPEQELDIVGKAACMNEGAELPRFPLWLLQREGG